MFSAIITDHPYTQGFHIEPTPRGTYLASGTAGSRIWAIEIDSNGTEIRRQTFYQTPSLRIFQEGTVKQATDGRYLVAGTYDTSNDSFSYLGSYDGFSGTTVWGGEKKEYALAPNILSDGSFIYYNYTYSAGQRNQYFTKYDKDSGLVWQVPTVVQFGASTIRMNAFAYNADSSVTAVGYLNYTNTPTPQLRQDFYIARISGVGVPYDPTTPVATRPQLGSRGGISIWPQPASHANGGALHFGGFAGPATLALYNMKGQQVLPVPGTAGTTTTTLLPRQPVAIGHLPPGLYVYRLVAKDRVWTGKVVVSE